VRETGRNGFQTQVIKELEREFPGCFIQKLDPNYRQGVPDLLMLWGVHWAVLEVKGKRPSPSDFEPNQEWYIDHLNEMSYSACVYPENLEDVLHGIQQAFQSRRPSRRAQRK
jgi:hypothetical protein